MHAAFVSLSPRCSLILRGSQARAGSCRATALAALRKPSLGGKAFETEPPIVFFPLDPKKRHLQWATWWVSGSSEIGGLSEDPKKRHQKLRKPGELRICRSQALLPLACCFQRGKLAGSGGTVLVLRARRYRSSRHAAVDSPACWMRHPNPFISLLSLMLLRIRATSHEQPLDDLH